MSKRKNRTTDKKENKDPKKAKIKEKTNTTEASTAPTLKDLIVLEEEPEKPKKKVKKTKTKASVEEIKIPETFADPTYDVTFKMLFGDEKNKDILISLLNSLLGFEGDQKKEITELELKPNELPVSFFSEMRGQSGIKSTIDIVCINKGKQKIAVEMQRQSKSYLLAREQEYMAKLISGQVKEKEGAKYHEKILETYILVIAKENMFPKGKIKDGKLFEIDVKPTIIQTQEIVPDNKMNWKFFELPKFKKSDNYKNSKIDKESPLKEQWLEFLVDCSTQETEPDRNDIIKKGYEIMKTAKWDNETKILYQRQIEDEQDRLEEKELALSSSKEAFKNGEIKGETTGKLKGEIKGEIKLIKTLTKLKQAPEQIKGELKFLTDPKVQDKFEANLKYITDNVDNSSLSDSQIFAGLDLAGLLAIEEHNVETI